MDDEDRKAALLLLAEERVGRRLRAVQAQEDAVHERSKAELRKGA